MKNRLFVCILIIAAIILVGFTTNAAQGSTYVDTFGYAENIDAAHPHQLPIWISPDILNVKRVRLHIDSQRFIAYGKVMAAGGETTATNSSGEGQARTTTSGNHEHVIFAFAGGNPGTSFTQWYSVKDMTGYQVPIGLNMPYVSEENKLILTQDDYGQSGSGGHEHTVSIDPHTHDVTIDPHTHELQYGIFEDTYPKDVCVKINGQQVAGPFGTDGNAFSQDIDLTPYIGIPGDAYNLEITSSCNGRVNVWVSIQASIKDK